MSLLKSIVLLGALSLIGAIASAEIPIPEEYKSGGFFVGCQAWTWNHFTVFATAPGMSFRFSSSSAMPPTA